jgi:uncharacterized protein (TIGR02145 family)
VGLLSVPASTSCVSPTPTPTPTMTPTNTVTPTITPTNTQTPTPSITPSITPSNSPVTRIQNNCDVITLFDLGISCNVIQNPSSPTSLDGIISVNVTGGTAPYSYYWNGNAGAQTLFGVTQGDYEILVTDFSWPDGGPDYTASTICSLFGPTPTQTPTMTPTPTSTRPIQCVELCMIITDSIRGTTILGPIQFECYGYKNGQFTWFGEWNGKPLYIIWNPINNRWEVYSDSQGNQLFNLGSTSLSNYGTIIASTSTNAIPVSAWNLYGEESNANVTVTTGSCPEYSPLSLNLAATNNSCLNMVNCDGSIIANAQGGLAPYFYSINGGITTQESPSFNGYCPNDYEVIVYDSIGNQQSSVVNIGYNGSPVTYQLSITNFGSPVSSTVPNVSDDLTQTYKIVSVPPIPVGLTISFNLSISNTKTYQGPGNGTIDNTLVVTKNNVPQTLTFVSNAPVIGTRANCSPDLQTGITQTNSVILTMSYGDEIEITENSNLILTNPAGGDLNRCLTSLIQDISSNITQTEVVGNECSTAVGGSRTLLENSISYVPTANPTVLRCFGYLYNFYAITGSTTQSLTSSDNWSVPTQSDFQTLISSVSNDARVLKLVNPSPYWNSNNSAATNTSGFSAKGSGSRITNADNGFGGLREQTRYNSKTVSNINSDLNVVLILQSTSNTTQLLADVGATKNAGNSVRLVRNTTLLLPGQTGTYTGNDGKTYNTICIGTQEWMSEDLTETKYRNLSNIPNVTNYEDWKGLTTGAYCIYNNDPLNVNGCPQTNCLPITKINIPFFYAYSIQPSGQPQGTPIDFTSSEISACNGINTAVNVVSPNTSTIYSLSRSVQSLSVGSKVYDGLNPNPITTCSPYLTTMNGYFCTNVTTKEITHVVNGIIQSITYCP